MPGGTINLLDRRDYPEVLGISIRKYKTIKNIKKNIKILYLIILYQEVHVNKQKKRRSEGMSSKIIFKLDSPILAREGHWDAIIALYDPLLVF